MTKRTRTNLNISSGISPMAGMIKSSYPCGTVGLVFQDEELASDISKIFFSQGNNVKSLHVSDVKEGCFEDNIRYLLGVGGKEITEPLRGIASGNTRYAYYCTEIAPDYFCNSKLGRWEKKPFAEFAYFDYDKFDVRDTVTLSKGYSTIVSLLVSLLDIKCRDLLKPYNDIELNVLIKGLKEFLFQSVGSDKYYSSMLNLIKNSMEYFICKNEIPFIYRLRENYYKKWDSREEFFSAYLLLYLGLTFTKWNFNDMLIPASVPNERNRISAKVLLEKSRTIADSMLSREELREIALTFRGQENNFEGMNPYETFSCIISVCPSAEGLFSEINNMGVIEGIIDYEKHKGY